MSRIIWLITDSLGIGALPDSEKFGDINVNTLGNIVREYKDIKIPNLIWILQDHSNINHYEPMPLDLNLPESMPSWCSKICSRHNNQIWK